MKFEHGDKVVINHSGEVGTIVNFINKDMAVVEVDGVKFPVFLDKINYPYFKQFSKKAEPAPKPKTYIEDLKKEKETAKYKVGEGIWLALLPVFDKDVFDACPTAKVFANFSVGFDNVDLEEVKKRNISISNTPGTSSMAVAEHTVAFMLTLTTRIDEGDRFMRKGKYKGWDPNLLVGTDLKGKTLKHYEENYLGTENVIKFFAITKFFS
jgi:lactate dehydrogenase-like 2-hydroxyacid dehydrogenase